MKTKVISIYSICTGIAVLGMWSIILVKGNIPEGKTELTFHLVSEFLMAIICLISGVMMLRKHSHAILLNTCGLAMLMYSVLNAAGYYGEQGDFSMMTFFIVLCLITIVALFLHLINSGTR